MPTDTPRIRINPSAEEQEQLDEWLLVGEVEDDLVQIDHFKWIHWAVFRDESGNLCNRVPAPIGRLLLTRAQTCTLIEHLAINVWLGEEVNEPDPEPEADPEEEGEK